MKVKFLRYQTEYVRSQEDHENIIHIRNFTLIVCNEFSDQQNSTSKLYIDILEVLKYHKHGKRYKAKENTLK